MGFFSNLLANGAARWLGRFQARHQLGMPVESVAQNSLWAREAKERLLLHVGCGHATLEQIGIAGFHAHHWREVRQDADESVNPDVLGSMTEMGEVPSAAVQAVFSSHGIEHLYWHDVPKALAEFHRVLADDGFLVITCPDLQSAAQMIAEDRLFETAYLSQAGPITPFDILYSYRPFVERNPQWMSHHCGFTLSVLAGCLKEAGFPSVYGIRREAAFDLWVLASKAQRSAEELSALAAEYLPVVS